MRTNLIVVLFCQLWLMILDVYSSSSSAAGSAAGAGSAAAVELAPPPGCLLNFVSNCLRFRS